MKKILIVLLFLNCNLFAGMPEWRLPPKVVVSTFAVNDYSNNEYFRQMLLSHGRDVHEKDLQAINSKQVFVNSLFASLSRKYPSLYRLHVYDRTDDSAKVADYKELLLYRSEFVYFAGHGSQQKIYLYDLPMTVSAGCAGDGCSIYNYGKVYGEDTRWVIFDACEVLNVNKDGMLDRELNVNTIDYSKVQKLISVFAGVHAILGYYSISFDGYDNVYSYFSKYFIEDGYTLWDSFSMANDKVYREKRAVSYARGIKPAIAFLRGTDEKGVYHDTSAEFFALTYNQPIKISGNIEMLIMYKEYGTPIY
jgi:hypothetical protein